MKRKPTDYDTDFGAFVALVCETIEAHAWASEKQRAMNEKLDRDIVEQSQPKRTISPYV